MALTKQDQLLEDLERCFVGLVSLFRKPRYLTLNDQLFIENRLLLLQMEYNLWSARLGRATRLPSAKDLTTDIQPSSPPRHQPQA
jgi:hypothetical protein